MKRKWKRNMENKSHALLAGAFTLVLLAAAIFIGIWLNRDRVEWVPYQIATKLSVPGLNPQASVRYRGLEVGKVEDIGFDPKEVGQILVRINVRPDTPITQSTFATLGYQGVTGIAYVQLDDDGTRPIKMESSPQKIARIEMRPSVFDQIQTRGLAILDQTEAIAKRVNDFLQPDNQQAILGTFDGIRKAAAEIETIPRQLQPALAKVPALSTQAQQTLTSVQALTTNLTALTTTLQAPDGMLARIDNTADQISAAANRLEHEALPLASDARGSLRALNRMLDGLHERPQSVLFGWPVAAPGPGESGFSPPSK
jgi:phospholipid/cholesterol/gamma-HCH transport system substrate-binding protein